MLARPLYEPGGVAGISQVVADGSRIEQFDWQRRDFLVQSGRSRVDDEREALCLKFGVGRAANRAKLCEPLRQLDGSVMSWFTTRPEAAIVVASRSVGLVPTLPMCGKVKVMIWPAKDGSVRVS